MESADMEVLDRTDISNRNICFITLKGHKESFLKNPTVHLIKPAKSELGRISKAILDNISKGLCDNLNINQWKNTGGLMNSFIRIEQKHLSKFIMFHIKDIFQYKKFTKQKIQICRGVHRYRQR